VCVCVCVWVCEGLLTCQLVKIKQIIRHLGQFPTHIHIHEVSSICEKIASEIHNTMTSLEVLID